MKKLFAIVLALMLLATSAAFAEKAEVVTIADPFVVVTKGEDSFQLSLEGLTITAAIGLSGEIPTIQFEADNGDEALLGGEAQIVDDKLVLALDGLSRPLAADISAAGEQGIEGIKTLFGSLEELSQIEPPYFTGVTIPKLDLISLASLIGAEAETDASGAQVATFEVPYEMVKSLMETAGEFRSLVPDEAQEQAGFVFDLIDQLVASDTGFALSGVVTDDGATSQLVLDVYPVEEGVTADAAFGALVVAFAENQVNVAVDLYDGEDAMTLGEFALTSEPDAATLSFGLDVLGAITANGSLYPQDGAQVAALAFDFDGESVNLSLVYGEEDGVEYADFIVDVPGQLSLDCYAQSTDDGNSGEVGQIAISAEVGDEEAFSLTADIAESFAEFQFDDIANVADAIDMENVSEEENAQLEAELDGVLEGLLNYIGTLEFQPAA